jgi:hypothetical protein
MNQTPEEGIHLSVDVVERIEINDICSDIKNIELFTDSAANSALDDSANQNSETIEREDILSSKDSESLAQSSISHTNDLETSSDITPNDCLQFMRSPISSHVSPTTTPGNSSLSLVNEYSSLGSLEKHPEKSSSSESSLMPKSEAEFLFEDSEKGEDDTFVKFYDRLDDCDGALSHLDMRNNAIEVNPIILVDKFSSNAKDFEGNNTLLNNCANNESKELASAVKSAAEDTCPYANEIVRDKSRGNEKASEGKVAEEAWNGVIGIEESMIEGNTTWIHTSEKFVANEWITKQMIARSLHAIKYVIIIYNIL